MAIVRSGVYEFRRGCAACFRTKKVNEQMPDFTGVVVLEDGKKFWLNVWEKTTKQGDRYLSIALRPKEDK